MGGGFKGEWRRSVTTKLTPTDYLDSGEQVYMIRSLGSGNGIAAAVWVWVSPPHYVQYAIWAVGMDIPPLHEDKMLLSDARRGALRG